MPGRALWTRILPEIETIKVIYLIISAEINRG